MVRHLNGSTFEVRLDFSSVQLLGLDQYFVLSKLERLLPMSHGGVWQPGSIDRIRRRDYRDRSDDNDLSESVRDHGFVLSEQENSHLHQCRLDTRLTASGNK